MCEDDAGIEGILKNFSQGTMSCHDICRDYKEKLYVTEIL